MKKFFYSFLILLVFFVISGVNAQPNPPTLLLPPDNATNVSLYPTFTWSTSSGATFYHLQVFQGPTTVIDQGNITGTSFNVTAAVLTGNTYYYWHVSAGNTGGEGTYSGFFHFTTAVVAPAPPALQSPPNGAIDIPLTPTLNWNDVPGATQYHVQVSTSSTFSPLVVDVGGLNNSAYTIQTGALSNSQTYYWRANASNSGGTSNWSDPYFSFTTVPAPPIAPTLSFPANNAVNIPVTVTLKWRYLNTATQYQVEVSANIAFTQIVVNEYVTDTLYTIPGGTLSGLTDYYWRVNASNTGGIGPWSSIWKFTTGIAPPASPVLLVPVNGAIGIPISNVLFDWGNVASATSYRIQISLSSNFGTTFVNQVTGATSQYTHTSPPFANNTTYYWRVNASNAGGTGAWSQVWSFTTIEPTLPAPILLSPPNNSVNISLTPLMDWTDVSLATGYRLQISTNINFTSYVVNVQTTTSEYQVPSGILQGYTVYYWRVATINGGGTGTNSAAWNFRTVQSFNLTLKVFLEGFYNGTTQTSDTIKIYLAQSTTPYTFKDSSSALLGSDGMINNLSFARATTGSYYIVVVHRNHIETWSANAMFFQTGNTVNFNFTDNPTKAYCGNMKQVGSNWALWGGDANQDGNVSPLDYDMFKPQFGSSGYQNCDFNGDGFVDGYDLPILSANFGKSKCRPY